MCTVTVIYLNMDESFRLIRVRTRGRQEYQLGNAEFCNTIFLILQMELVDSFVSVSQQDSLNMLD